MFREDYLRFMGREPRTLAHLAYHVLREPGLQAVGLMRLQLALHRRGWGLASILIRNFNLHLTGLDAQNGASIGGGLVVRHPVGVVIGSGVIIGPRCTVLQQVTLGERRIIHGGAGEYPRIEADVILAAGAKVLGACVVGEQSLIGANAVVTVDIPARSVVAPAAVTIRKR